MSFIAPLLATQIGTTTVGAVLAKTAIIGGLTAKVGGIISGGVAQERQARVEADIAEIGVISEKTRASEEREVASREEIERREKGRRDVARVISRTAASGFELAGTPLLQISDFLTDIEQDIGEIRFTGEKKARAAESRAVAKTLQGMTLKQIGKARKTEALFEAGSSLLTGIGNIFNP
jgi:hypothetical protein